MSYPLGSVSEALPSPCLEQIDWDFLIGSQRPCDGYLNWMLNHLAICPACLRKYQDFLSVQTDLLWHDEAETKPRKTTLIRVDVFQVVVSYQKGDLHPWQFTFLEHNMVGAGVTWRLARDNFVESIREYVAIPTNPRPYLWSKLDPLPLASVLGGFQDDLYHATEEHGRHIDALAV